MYRGEYCSVEDDLRTVQNVTTAQISELVSKYPLTQLTTTGVGPLADLSFQD